MPNIEPHLNDALNPVSPPEPRTALFWDGTHWHVPRVDDHGRVQVRGEDQLHSFLAVAGLARSAVISGAGGFVDSLPCLAGEIWHITNITAYDATSPTTQHTFILRHGGVDFEIDTEVAAIAAWQTTHYHGHVWLDENDTIRVYFIGGLVGDTCHVILTGHSMTLET